MWWFGRVFLLFPSFSAPHALAAKGLERLRWAVVQHSNKNISRYIYIYVQFQHSLCNLKNILYLCPWILLDSVNQKGGISDGAPSIQLFAMFVVQVLGKFWFCHCRCRFFYILVGRDPGVWWDRTATSGPVRRITYQFWGKKRQRRCKTIPFSMMYILHRSYHRQARI